jgi:hypothetical protein
MAKPIISAVVRPAEHLISRQSESFASTPSQWVRGWTTNGCVIYEISGSAMLEPLWKPSSYQWGLDEYQVVPTDRTAWAETKNALGRGDKSIGFAGNASNPPATPWSAFLTDSHSFGRNQGVLFNFIWYRPAGSTFPDLNIYPRMDPIHAVWYYGTLIYFTPFRLVIDSQMKMMVYEYPYDTFAPFISNPLTALTQVYTHPIIVKPEDLAAEWHSIEIIAASDEDIRINSDILFNGGFLFRSSLDRKNIWMLPEGVAGMHSLVGGLSQVEITPLETPAVGTIKSSKMSKSASNSVYPTMKVFGWSPSAIDTDRGFLKNQNIPNGDIGFGGIKYRILSVTGEGAGEVETEVDPDSEEEFQDFKVEVELTPLDNVSPVINDLILDYENETDTLSLPTVDISADIMEITESISDEVNYKATIKIRNRDGIYNALAERIMNEIDLDIDGKDKAVLYTLNTSYEWWKTPYQSALELNWDCGDGFEYLKRDLVVRHPPYDGLMLSEAIREFLNREGFGDDRLDIDPTPTLYLPKKHGADKYQFKPEDGTPAVDFIQQLAEWFRSEWTCRFAGDGKFEFKEALDINGQPLAIARTYYTKSEDKPDPDDHLVYTDVQVELLQDQFFNEIWVCGLDKRRDEPIISVFHNLPSQTDPNAHDYVGRRLVMLVPMRVNTLAPVSVVCQELTKHYGILRTRVVFNTRLDPELKKDDFIIISGVAHTWRVVSINNNVNIQTMASSTINSTTPVIRGMQVTAIQWPLKI